MASWQSRAIMIVPTYNERENLEKLTHRLRSVPGDIHVLVVDDNSPDGTGAIADSMAATRTLGVHVRRFGKLLVWAQPIEPAFVMAWSTGISTSAR